MTQVTCYADWSWHQLGATGTKANAGNINVGYRSKDTGSFRGAIRFPLTDLPSGATVTKVELIIYCGVAGGSAGLWDIQPYNNDGQRQPCDDTGQPFWDNCNPATVYINDTTNFRVVGYYTFDLGVQAVNDVQAAKSAVDRFSLGFHEEGDNDVCCTLCGGGGAQPWAQLVITYTVAGINIPVAMHHYMQMTKIRRG